jgi:ABC-2 type transport system permease protein
MLQHLGITFAALALVRERQSGTILLLQVSPVTTGQRLAGKTLAFLLLGAAAAAILTLLLVLAFDVPLPTDWLSFTLLLALTLLASLGIGYLVTGTRTRCAPGRCWSSCSGTGSRPCRGSRTAGWSTPSTC